MNIDVDRCRRAMKHLCVHGNPAANPRVNQTESGRPRWKQIEAVINWIAQNGATAIMYEEVYVEHDATFGDRSGECPNGRFPHRANIVFGIGRTDEGLSEGVVLNADHIYLLECVRAAGLYKTTNRCYPHGNLCDAIAELDEAQHGMLVADAWLVNVIIEAHGKEPMPDITDEGRTASYAVKIAYAIGNICKGVGTRRDRPTELDVTITRLCRAFLQTYNAYDRARDCIAKLTDAPTSGYLIEFDAELCAILTGEKSDA